jgi:N-formylmaleamate deformylase
MQVCAAICLAAICIAACGGTAPRATRGSGGDTDSPFGRDANFEPVAFGVDVEGEGRPVILIPGLACPGEVWSEVVAHLTEGEFETHTLTLSGFAGRPRIDEPLSQAVRRDLTRYIRAKRMRDPIIIGHSMGGFIAYWLASYHPELTGPVIIVDASPALSGDLEEAKQLRNKWRKASDEEYFAQVRAKFMSMTRQPQRMKPVIDLIVKSDRRVIGDAIFEMIQTNLIEAVAEIKAPVLIVTADRGLQSRIITQAKGIPDHEVVVIPRTGHFVMWDDAPAFFRAIDKFLAKHADES